MGFYLRKSVRLGPFRLNLSKSGLGISTGVKGFRVGVGPRGTYIHAGLGGVYYRSTLSPKQAAALTSQASPLPLASHDAPTTFRRFGSAPIADLAEDNDDSVLAEINRCAKKHAPWATLGLVLALLLSPFLLYGLHALTPADLDFAWVVGLWPTALLLFYAWAHYAQAKSRTVLMLFELDDALKQAYLGLYDAFDAVRKSEALWYVQGQAATGNPKAWAGQDWMLLRERIQVGFTPPSVLRTNLPVPNLKADRKTFYFLPDRVLVAEGDTWADADYSQLLSVQQSIDLPEFERPPTDAPIVGQTWRHTNKHGDPDRRYRDNPPVPILRLSQWTFSTQLGIDETYLASKPQVFQRLHDALGQMARTLPPPRESSR